MPEQALQEVVVEPMAEPFILWRCLHGGPLSLGTIDTWPADGELTWAAFRARNLPLLRKLTAAYGACAMVARVSEEVVGMLRFYPRAIAGLPQAGGLCLQQQAPNGPSGDLADQPFPPLDELADRGLVVHCIMTGSPQQASNPYQRRGVGSRLARALEAWARERGWQEIDVTTYEDLPILYGITGAAGRTFWERLGYRLAKAEVEPEMLKEGDFAAAVMREAAAAGMPREQACQRYLMRLELR